MNLIQGQKHKNNVNFKSKLFKYAYFYLDVCWFLYTMVWIFFCLIQECLSFNIIAPIHCFKVQYIYHITWWSIFELTLFLSHCCKSQLTACKIRWVRPIYVQNDDKTMYHIWGILNFVIFSKSHKCAIVDCRGSWIASK